MIDLPALDRDVARASAAIASFHAELREPVEDRPAAPLASIRRVSTRELFDALAPLEADPWASALRRWVAYLVLERVTAGDQVRVADAWHERAHRTERGELVSVSELVERSLFGAVDPERWARELVVAAAPMRRAARFADARWREGARMLEGLDLAALEHPGVSASELEAAARALLSATEPLAAPARDATFTSALGAAFGRDAGEGWPIAPSPRWLEGIFGGTLLLEGLRPRLGALPRALGASSYARALARLGEALASQDRPTGPFALARRPFEPLVAARAALFAALVAEPSFHARALGLGRPHALEQARRAASALLVDLRWLAARVRVVDAFVDLEERGAMSAHADAAKLALGVASPGELAGVVPRHTRRLRLRLQGALTAVLTRFELRDRFDEDWWRNPRAHEALRHEHQRPWASSSPATPLDGAPAAVASWLAELGAGG